MAQILVIDDDADIAALVSLKLAMDGHTVAVEGHGARGLQRAQQDCPDVLIVDWTLPGLSGPDICAELRSDPAMSSIWMIMLTARPLGQHTASSVDADEVLTKPFSPRELSARVTAALAR